MNYPMYNNSQYYMQNLQDMRDRIDNQIKSYQQSQMQQPMTQPTNLTQNFQIAPQQNNNDLEGKFVNTIDDVKNIFVLKTGIFATKDFSTIWVKDVSGKIRTFDTEEILEIDDKDKEIIALKEQIEELKGMIKNEYDNASSNEQTSTEKSKTVSRSKSTNAK